MSMGDATSWVTGAGALGLFGVLIEVYRTYREGRAQRAEMRIKAVNAPAATQSLLMGSADQAVAAQTKVIENLQAHATWLEKTNSGLRAQLVEKDGQIAEMVATVAALNEQLSIMQVKVNELTRRLEEMQKNKGP